MKKKIPSFGSDKEAEDFVDKADLSKYRLGGARLVRFELKPKDRMVSLRLSSHLLDAVRRRAGRARMPVQRFMRMAIEDAVSEVGPRKSDVRNKTR